MKIIESRARSLNTFVFSNLGVLCLALVLVTTSGCSLFSRQGESPAGDGATESATGPAKGKTDTGRPGDSSGPEKNPNADASGGGGNADGSGVSITPWTEDSPKSSRRVAVVLGPGGYKTFAHIGVLKALQRGNVPVHAVVGIEWGSLVGALYAQRAQVHEVEWKLYKLEKLDLDSSGFFSRSKNSLQVESLRGFLKENLELADVKQAAVPFFCPSLALATGTFRWQGVGVSMATATEKCLPAPPHFQAATDDWASLLSVNEIILRLRREGYNVIIGINVLGDGSLFPQDNTPEIVAAKALWSETRRSFWTAKASGGMELIEVNTRGVEMDDFESRRMLVTAGESAGEKAATALTKKYDF
jgi:NTE family protein